MADLKDTMQGDSGSVREGNRNPLKPQNRWIGLKPGRNAEEVCKNLCFATSTVAHCSDWQLVIALGTTLEFKAPGTFKPVTDMIGGGPFGLQPGQ
jgi:hypothetical protein